MPKCHLCGSQPPLVTVYWSTDSRKVCVSCSKKEDFPSEFHCFKCQLPAVHPYKLYTHKGIGIFCSAVCYYSELKTLGEDCDDLAFCQKCRTEDADLICSRCHSALYCSRECQKADRPSHKKVCFVNPTSHDDRPTSGHCYFCRAECEGDRYSVCEKCQKRPDVQVCFNCPNPATHKLSSRGLGMARLFFVCSDACTESLKLDMMNSGSFLVCQACGELCSNRRCAACDKINYCSVECQKADWPRHKELCGKESSWETHYDKLCKLYKASE